LQVSSSIEPGALRRVFCLPDKGLARAFGERFHSLF
jgi:hypothetical protein